jgi:hypothetical protein
MHPAIEGALVGLGLGALLTAYEYYSVKKQVEERAAARHEKPQFEPTDKARINAVVRFALFLPPGAAVMFWLWSAMS